MTKTIYVKGNKFGNSYCSNTSTELATKWRVSYLQEGNYREVVGARLLESCISLTEKIEAKIEKSNNWLRG